MAIRTIQELKSVYQNGLYPNQFNFEDVFDTMFDLKTGSEILILDHVPLNSEGKLGDMVLVENNSSSEHGNLYQRNTYNDVSPTLSTEWVLKGNIAGVQGVAGIQGPVGPQGVIGPIGVDGPTGPAGPIGPSGLPVDSNFYAISNSLQTILTNDTLLFGNQIIDIGSDYNPSNGKFTAPVNGNYYFEVLVTDNNGALSSNQFINLKIEIIDESDSSVIATFYLNREGTASNVASASGFGQATLSLNDQVSVKATKINGSEDVILKTLSTTFSGFVVGGPTGPTGLTGPAGSTGSIGATGPQGPTGANGAQGVAGPAGPQGLQGNPGVDGTNGTNGTNGNDGTNGTNGVDGTIGATGPQGVQGLTGAQGIQGPIGNTGAPGATGSAGTNGADGADGATGSIGPAGPQGPTGSAGADGNDGTNGTNGTDGNDGAQGATGAAGTDGADGAQGIQGIQGVAGNDGADGTNGTNGTDGADGSTPVISGGTNINVAGPAATPTVNLDTDIEVDAVTIEGTGTPLDKQITYNATELLFQTNLFSRVQQFGGPTLILANPVETKLPNSYPSGYSYTNISPTDGWPVRSTMLETFRYGSTVVQTVYGTGAYSNGGMTMRHSDGSNNWQPFTRISTNSVEIVATTTTVYPESYTSQYCLTTLGSDTTIYAPASHSGDNGRKFVFRIKDDGTIRNLTWTPADYTAIGVTLPTATTPNKTLYVGCIYNGSTSRWDVVAVSEEA